MSLVSFVFIQCDIRNVIISKRTVVLLVVIKANELEADFFKYSAVPEFTEMMHL